MQRDGHSTNFLFSQFFILIWKGFNDIIKLNIIYIYIYIYIYDKIKNFKYILKIIFRITFNVYKT